MDILTPIDGFDDLPLSRLTLAHMMLFVIHVKLGVFFWVATVIGLTDY